MKAFETHAARPAAALRELARFRKLLAERATLSEASDIRPLFRECPQLCLLLGQQCLPGRAADRVAYEYDLFGDFACDLVVGSSSLQQYVFVEFEDAEPDSIFKRAAAKARRDWSPRFDHGYSQIIDWFGKLHDMEGTAEFEARFGARSIRYNGLLVIGRDQHLEPGERHRLDWRRTRVVVDSKVIECLTFDELLVLLSVPVEGYEAVRVRRQRGK